MERPEKGDVTFSPRGCWLFAGGSEDFSKAGSFLWIGRQAEMRTLVMIFPWPEKEETGSGAIPLPFTFPLVLARVIVSLLQSRGVE